ncbi:MAG: holo-ACP synthase [Lautropia sp.]
MIYGIGTDVVLLGRIRALCERHGDRFVRRVLGPDEMREFERRRARGPADGAIGNERAVRYVAKRFAGKEAFSKALGLGLRGPMTLLSLQILNDRRGKPYCVARNELAPHLASLDLVAHVSLTDEKDSAQAFVILETRRNGDLRDPAQPPDP